MKIKKGDRIAVEYEGKFEDGMVFDSSNRGGHVHPLEFEAGAGQVIAGFDNAVIGMEEGQEKEVRIMPGEAYGEHRNDFVQKIPRAALPQDKEPKVGMVLYIENKEGQPLPLRITAVDNDTITLDLNHPLAGKVLIFKLKIVGINDTIKPHNH